MRPELVGRWPANQSPVARQNMKIGIFKKVLTGICAAAMLMTTASADTVIYSLNAPNVPLSPYTGPYGTVTVNRTDSTHATITFASSVVGGYQYLFGSDDPSYTIDNLALFARLGVAKAGCCGGL